MMWWDRTGAGRGAHEVSGTRGSDVLSMDSDENETRL